MHSQTSSVFGPAVAKSQLMVKSDEGCCVSGWLGSRLINLQIDKDEEVFVSVCVCVCLCEKEGEAEKSKSTKTGTGRVSDSPKILVCLSVIC